MKTRQIISVYVSGFLVGIALVLFPAAGNIFIDPGFHGFSSAQYGSIFIPQIILAILSSLLAPKLSKKTGMKRILLLGLMSLFLAMIFMVSSNWFFEGNIDYWIIMLATAFIGAGFGFTITALNPLAYNLFPGKETSAVTAMHIMLGLGTASSAIVLNAYFASGFWWGAPLSVAVMVLIIMVFTIGVALELPKTKTEQNKSKSKAPKRVWLFAIAVFLYGACEATFGNFGAVFLEKEGGLSLAKASLGLSLFWGGITMGRILFTFIALRFTTNVLYIVAPFLVALIFYVLPYAIGETILLICMALGGLGLSFLFPKSISAATDEFPGYAALISGALVASIQLGTGFSSNIIGVLNKNYPLHVLFQFSALYAFVLGMLIMYLNYTKK